MLSLVKYVAKTARKIEHFYAKIYARFKTDKQSKEEKFLERQAIGQCGKLWKNVP